MANAHKRSDIAIKKMSRELPYLFCVVFALNLVCLHGLNATTDKPTGLDLRCSEQTNKTCKDCISIKGCSWCAPNKVCSSKSATSVILHGDCPGQEWNVGQCIVSGKVIIIAVPVAAVVFLLFLGICLYCCCCRRCKKWKNKRYSKEEAKFKRQREEIEIKHAERRAERQQKHDAIRKKYGLYRKSDDEDANGKYHQFENQEI